MVYTYQINKLIKSIYKINFLRKVKTGFIILLLLSSFLFLDMPLVSADSPESVAPIVVTNETTNVEETTATLNGYLQDDGGENCTAWFEYGINESYGSVISSPFSWSILNDEGDGATDIWQPIIGSSNNNNAIHCSIEFHPDVSFTVTAVNLYIQYFETPYALNVDVYMDNGVCDYSWTDGTLVKDNWQPTWATGWQSLTLDTPYDVEAGQTYEISFYTTNTGTSGDYFYIFVDNSAPGTYYRYYYNQNWGFARYPDMNLSGIYYPNVTSGTQFNVTLSNLNPGTLYHYRAVGNNSNSTVYGSDVTFLTKPEAPTALVISDYVSALNLTWTTGVGANNTYIERNTSTNWTLGEGTEVYNGTLEYYNDTSISNGTAYYYQLWGYTEWDSLSQYSDNITSDSGLALGTPNVITNVSTGVEETNATLNGYLLDNGGENCTVRFEYGNSTGYGTNTSNQTKTTGQTFSINITNLTRGQLYHYRAYANNSVYSSNGTDKSFLTKPSIASGSSATAISSSQINLAWTKGNGSNNTFIIRKTGSYPSSRTDGSVVYNGTGTSFSDSGLSASTAYYYRIWSYSEWNALHQWSDEYTNVSATTGASGGGGGPSPPSSPPQNNPVEKETPKEQVEDLFNIDLAEDFYATDEDGDGINDTFNDPNGILEDLRFVNINGNASFLISVNGDKDLLFIWDTDSGEISEVEHTLGTIDNTIYDDENESVSISVIINKTGWVYLEIEDDFSRYRNLQIETSDGRIISDNMIWRHGNKIYLLDDPSLEYIFTFSRKSGRFLFDVILELTSYSVIVGQSIDALITLINVGDPGLVNASLSYTLYKGEEIIWVEEENLSIFGQLAFNKTISTAGLDIGEYTFEVIHYYGDNQTASALGTFQVKVREPTGEIPLWIYVIFIIIIILLSLFFYWFFKVKKTDTDKDNYTDIRKEIDEKYQELVRKKYSNK